MKRKYKRFEPVTLQDGSQLIYVRPARSNDFIDRRWGQSVAMAIAHHVWETGYQDLVVPLAVFERGSK